MKKMFSKSRLFGALAVMLGMGVWGSVISTDSFALKDMYTAEVRLTLESPIDVDSNSIVVKYADEDKKIYTLPNFGLYYKAYQALKYDQNKNKEKEKINNDFEEQRNEYLAKVEEELLEKTSVASVPVATSNPAYSYHTEDGLTPSGGVNYYGDQKETYYNLNMNNVVNNARNSGIEGEYWVRDDGVKMYGDKVIVAANQDVHPYGSTVETSLGEGIVLDTGSFAVGNPTQVDIATDW